MATPDTPAEATPAEAAPENRWRTLRRYANRLRQRTRLALRRYLPSESQHLFALTLAVGVVCGLTAVAFHLAIQAAEHQLIERALSLQGSQLVIWGLLCPTLGGLVAGAVLTWLVPGARGSGIPQVKLAFARDHGRVRFRDAFGKFCLASLQIGSGASLGREGPTVQICAGATSLLARLTGLPQKSARRLTPVGVAAGIAAAFNAPIAAVTFTIEEIVGNLDQTVLSGVVVAAALAAVIERSLLGVHPVIEVQQAYGLDHASSLLFYALLGVAAAAVSVVFTDGLLGLRRGFRALRVVPTFAHPAIGGFVTGALALTALWLFSERGITGGGYDTLSQALAGQLSVGVLVALCAFKIVATVFSYSSGGAGGIFAPSLFIGAMLGGAVGYLDVDLLQHSDRQLGAFALVGMGAVFAGVVRAPITSVLIIFEMTGGYGLVLPLMLANMVSYGLARHFRPIPIYEALLAQDGVVLGHELTHPHVLDRLTVADAMTARVVGGFPEQTVASALTALGESTFPVLPVTTASGDVAGIVRTERLRNQARDDVQHLLQEYLEPARTIRADAPLIRAVVRMHELSTRQLLVVDPAQPKRLVGVVSMSDVLRAHARAAPPVDDSLRIRTSQLPT